MDNDSLRGVFEQLHAKIVKDVVDPDSVIDELLSLKVITRDDYRKLRQAQTSKNRCRDLLSLLYDSTHPETFIQLRLALRDEYPSIVKEIDKQLEQLPSETAQLQQLHLGQSTEGKFLLPLPAYNFS